MGAEVERSILGDGCVVEPDARIIHSVVGLRSIIREVRRHLRLRLHLPAVCCGGLRGVFMCCVGCGGWGVEMRLKESSSYRILKRGSKG